jgi:hypothetical protein
MPGPITGDAMMPAKRDSGMLSGKIKATSSRPSSGLLSKASPTGKDEVSDCPFCGVAMHNLPLPDANGVPKPVQCRKCWEYSGLQKAFVSPYNPNAVEERPTFRSPLAQSVVWPNGCVQCGATPTRFDEGGTFAVNKGLLMVGAVRVKTFKLGGVPYCDAHKKAVEMKTEIGNKLFLDWRSLPMMRRYMAANRGRFAG